MSRPTVLLALAMLAATSAAAAQTPPEPQRIITVMGVGEARREADFATLGYSVRGEATTAVEAMAAAVKAREAIEAGLKGMRNAPRLDFRNSQFSVQDVRARGCASGGPYPVAMPNAAVLSTGDCAVVGAIATLDVQARVWPAEKFGDAASMATQKGAKNVGYRGGGLDSDDALTEAASQAAVAEARRQAALLARSSGVTLGPILRVSDGMAYSPPMADMVGFPAPPPPPPPPPPASEALSVSVAFKPPPIVRTARVTLTFAIAP